MKRTTLFIDEGMERDLQALARRRAIPVAKLVRESLGQYLAAENRKQGLTLRFLGRGHSGRKDIAERHEDLLWRDLFPHAAHPRQHRRG